MKRLLVLFFMVASNAAFAQATGTVDPSPALAEPSTKEVPSGACMPIGLTASGEIVFPIQCKEFIERQRGPVVELKPAASEEKPAPVAKQEPEGAGPVTVIRPVETVPLPKQRSVEQRGRREHRKFSGWLRKKGLPRQYPRVLPAGMVIYEVDETGTIFLPR
jgi:hypothetical protein